MRGGLTFDTGALIALEADRLAMRKVYFAALTQGVRGSRCPPWSSPSGGARVGARRSARGSFAPCTSKRSSGTLR